MKPTKKLFYTECHIAGRQYWEASEIWDKLKVGTQLVLDRETNNMHDPNAVAVYYHDAETDEYSKLGYIPRDENQQLANFLEMGWNEIFDARISRINPEAQYEQQLHVVIKIKRNDNKKED